MQTGEFVAAFREAFGPVPELPLLFRYTDEPLRPAAKAGGCFFKALAEARDGRPVGLNASNIGCGGGVKLREKIMCRKRARLSLHQVSVSVTPYRLHASRPQLLHPALGTKTCSLKRVRQWLRNALKKRYPLFSVPVQILNVLPLAAETLNISQKIRFLQVNVQPQSLTAFSQRVSAHH